MLCACASACAMAVASRLCASTAACMDSLVSAKPAHHSGQMCKNDHQDGGRSRQEPESWLKCIRAPLVDQVWFRECSKQCEKALGGINQGTCKSSHQVPATRAQAQRTCELRCVHGRDPLHAAGRLLRLRLCCGVRLRLRCQALRLDLRLCLRLCVRIGVRLHTKNMVGISSAWEVSMKLH